MVRKVKELEIPTFANVNAGKTDWVKLQKKKERIERRYFTSGIMLAISSGILLFSVLVFIKLLEA